jgi:hypothetical protein
MFIIMKLTKFSHRRKGVSPYLLESEEQFWKGSSKWTKIGISQE